MADDTAHGTATALAGAYRGDNGDTIVLTARADKLWLGPEEIRVTGAREGVIATMPDAFTLFFDEASPPAWVEIRAFGAAPDRRLRVEEDPDFDERRTDFEGRYVSSEIAANWILQGAGKALFAHFGEAAPLRLTNAGRDRARLQGGLAELAFNRDGFGRITGFTLYSARAHGIAFVRAADAQVSPLGAAPTTVSGV